MKRILFAAVGLSMFVGCGPLAGNGSGDFEGTWNIASGSETITCPSGSASSTMKGNQTIVEGTASDLVLTSDDGCNLKFNVKDGVATIVPGQTCTSTGTFSDGVPYTETDTYNSASITLGPDNRSVTITASLNAQLTNSSGSAMCTANVNATATKVGK